MFLKSITIENFRKFGDENKLKNNNTVEFVDAADYNKEFLENQKINIAPKTTLIIGKNNSGKTTVIQALDKLINGYSFLSNDFNFNYLARLLERYAKVKLADEPTIETPQMTFSLVIGLATGDKDDIDEDILTNIMPFMNLSDANESAVTIRINWEVQEKQLFINDLDKLFKKTYDKGVLFDKFLELIDESKYKATYYNEKNEKIEYSIKNLIEIASIRANKITNDSCLSESFAKIVEYRYKNCRESQNEDQQKISSELDDGIIDINKKLTQYVTDNHTKSFNNSIKKMMASEKCQILLKADLTFKKLITSVIQYQYLEGSASIPENQFGLGYTNLMMVIAAIISYMEKYPESSFNSKINIISIEEPETYMHPQMQENFIKSINDMISSLLIDKDKHVNSQIIITTHSAHIVNSKIHQGNTFNNINYIVEVNGTASVVCLKDEDIIALTKEQLQKVEKIHKEKKSKQTQAHSDESKLQNSVEIQCSHGLVTERADRTENKGDTCVISEKTFMQDTPEKAIKNNKMSEEELLSKYNDLSFIKKHIKFKVSELFFADYAIFVEGVTEYTLLQYYIEKNSVLSKYFGTVLLVDGCHSKMYENLIRLLKIPTLIITDLDIKREEKEKSENQDCCYVQIDKANIADRNTTNESLKHFYCASGKAASTKILKISDMIKKGYITKNKLIIATQLRVIENYYATSFEESFILTNYRNDILVGVLKQLKPNIYQNVINNGGLIKNSYKFQAKLSEDKSEFANNLLRQMIINDTLTEKANPKLPRYIEDGLIFLCKKLKNSVRGGAGNGK